MKQSDTQVPGELVEPESKKLWVSPRVTKLDARSAETGDLFFADGGIQAS